MVFLLRLWTDIFPSRPQFKLPDRNWSQTRLVYRNLHASASQQQADNCVCWKIKSKTFTMLPQSLRRWTGHLPGARSKGAVYRLSSRQFEVTQFLRVLPARRPPSSVGPSRRTQPEEFQILKAGANELCPVCPRGMSGRIPLP